MNGSIRSEPDDVEPFALELQDFIMLQIAEPVALLGTSTHPIIPAGGLVMLAGREGVGKTTFVIDLAFHLAAGLDWIYKVPASLNVLLLENEGPKLMFREKLRYKLERWPHGMNGTGRIHIQTMRWGYFSFADADARAGLVAYCDTHEIQVVIGDPLGSLGMTGVGSPEDVQKFKLELVKCGLGGDRAFLFLHHFRKEGADDEIKELQGAWGGPLDTLLTLKPGRHSKQLRLNVAKSRHFREELKPMIVGRVENTQAYELIGEEDDPRLLEEELVKLLEDGVWRTRDEIAISGKTPKDYPAAKPGIGANKEEVERRLKSNDHLFRSAPGNEHGRSARATLWQLAQGSEARLGGSSDGSAPRGEGQMPVLEPQLAAAPWDAAVDDTGLSWDDR